jgi:hypothetical protein
VQELIASIPASLSTARVVSMRYLHEEQSLFVAFAVGDLILLRQTESSYSVFYLLCLRLF